MAKYLDASGVQTVWTAVKNHVSSAIGNLDSSISAGSGKVLASIKQENGVFASGTAVDLGAGTLTVKINGSSKGTFNANATADATIDLGNFDASGAAAAAVAALDSSQNAGTGKYIQSITQTDGKLTSITTGTVGDAVLKIKINGSENATTFSANATSGATIDLGNFDASGTAATLIAALDSSKSASSGNYINSITITDGKLSAIGEASVPTALKSPYAETITVNGGSTEGTSKYTYDGAAAKAIDLSAGANVTLTATAGKITIAATDTKYTHPANAASGSALTAGTAQTPALGGSFYVSDVKIDASGHVTDDSRKIQVTLPTTSGSVTGDTTTFVKSVSLSSTGVLNGTTQSADSSITSQSSGIASSAAVVAYVAEKLAGASHYLGTVSAASGLSTSAEKGDFYRASADFTAGQSVKAGWLIIAEKDSPSQTIDGTNWTAIKSQDTDTTYTFATGDTNGTFKVTPSTSGASAQSVAIKGLAAMAYKAKVENADVSGTIADAHIASASTWTAKVDSVTYDAANKKIMVGDGGSTAASILEFTTSGFEEEASAIELTSSSGKLDISHATFQSYGGYGDASTTAPGFGDEITLVTFDVNKTGHVTDAEDVKVTLPATEATTTTKGLMTTTQVTKLNGITAGATADTSIPASELSDILNS